MLKGEAVAGFTIMFLQNWNINEYGKEDSYANYIRTDFPELKEKELPVGGYVLPYGDSPLDNENVGQNVYLDILNRAEKYVHIMTPYLILDNEMTGALTYALQHDCCVLPVAEALHFVNVLVGKIYSASGHT